MQPLQRRAGLLLCRFLSARRSIRSSAGAAVERPARCFSSPLRPSNPHTPVACVDSVLRAPLGCSAGGRGFCGGAEDCSKEVDEINLKFAEAREEIDAALESKDTVYFNEEAECAREAVKVVLDMFEGLLRRLPEKERAALQRSMGLKMEQLKAELQQLDE